MKKQYKALMLDLDGTVIPNRRDGRPSKNVINAIAKAKKRLHVGFISGRPYSYAKDIVKELVLNGPSIASGGAQIVDVITHKILWEKFLPKEQLQKIADLLHTYPYKIVFQINDVDSVLEDNKGKLPEEIVTLSIMDVEPSDVEQMFTELKEIPAIAVHKIVGWKKGTYWLQISHEEASKQHGIYEVAKILGIETHEIIGVGDGYNDFPLLMACGLKVAMGNAVPELKEIADYIAPSVDDDGVVDVIEKFIL